MTTAQDGGEGLSSRPCRSLPPGKPGYPLYRRLGGPQDRSGQVRKISPPPGFDPRNVQPVASSYTVGSVKCSLNQKQCMPDAVICNTDHIRPIFPNALSVGLQKSVVYGLKTSTDSLILLEKSVSPERFFRMTQ